MSDKFAYGHILWLTVPLLVCINLAQAQQPKTNTQIGFLGATSPSVEAARIEAFRDGLRELGYVEGQNTVIEWRWAEGKLERLPILAAELVRLNVDVIVAGGSTSTAAAKKATSKIPIVTAQVNDPVGSGLIASLARPGDNLTGLSTLVPEISGKRLEILKEIIPKLSRVLVFGDSTAPGNAQSLNETERAAKPFHIQIHYQDIVDAKHLETSFREAAKERADAILLLGAPVLISHRTRITELAAKNRIPVIFPQKEYVDVGGLMSYGVSIVDLYRRTATYVDKTLKGGNPSEMPVEQPTKFEFIINLKAAKQIGLTIPPNVLARADRVIK